MQNYVVFITCEYAPFSRNFIDSTMFCSTLDECKEYAAQELKKLREEYGPSVLCDAYIYAHIGETLS